MISRIGKKLLLAIILCIVVTVATVSVITIVSAVSSINGLMMDQAETGINVLRHRITENVDRIDRIENRLREVPIDTDAADAISLQWEIERESDYDFAAIYDLEGNLLWSSDGYKLADFNAARASSGYVGLVADSSMGLTVQNAGAFHENSIIVVGTLVGRNDLLDGIKEETGADLTLFNGKVRCATTLTDPAGARLTGSSMSADIAETVIDRGEAYSGITVLDGQKRYVNYQPFTDITGNVAGAYFAGNSTEYSDNVMLQMLITSVIVAIVVIIASAVIISVITAKIILVPIKEAEKVADGMSRGMLSEPDSEHQFANDELGDFVRKLEESKKNMSEYIKDINNVLGSMAGGDFTVRAQLQYIGDFTEINNSFEQIELELHEVIGSIGASANDVMVGSSQIADGSKMLADGTTRQAAAIEELSATINEIAGKVQSTADNAAEANKVSKLSSDKIEYQNTEVEQMLSAMDDIKKRSDEIRKIIQSIDDISFQTNILALNAAVEAARAGEAGKGFAVVAEEVRNLAAKSGEAAQQTGTLINATIDAVNKGADIAANTAATMKEVTELSNRTNAYISDISVASEEEADAITQVKIGIEQISTVVQQNSATAEETAAACSVLNEQSTNLEQQIGKLKVK
ncbi:MAG: methyl-accepting chemotaxis protein [Bacteroides sp.]|nr:methyl-accepting chemotaxis protein [Bacteroides sp.]